MYDYRLSIKYKLKEGSKLYEFISLRSFAECWDRCYEIAKSFNDNLVTIEVINYSQTKNDY